MLVCAGIILFRKFANIQKQSKEQRKRESEFLINLVAKGELQPDQLPQLSNLVENNAIDEVSSQLEITESPLDSILELLTVCPMRKCANFLKNWKKDKPVNEENIIEQISLAS